MGNPNPKCKFKKGNNANPLGARAHKPEIQAIRLLTRTELAEVISMVVKGDIQALLKIKDQIKNPDPDPAKRPTVMQAVAASVAITAMNKGNFEQFDRLISRTIGKVKEEVEITGEDKTPLQMLVKIVDAKRD